MRRSLVSSCAAVLAVISTAGAAELSSSQITAAHKLYNTKCTKCHELYDATKYNPTDWETWMLKMKKKSRLKDDQYDLLDRYTAKIRAGEIVEKPRGKN